MKILVYIDLQDGVPTALSRELVAGARRLAGQGGSIELALIGGDADAARKLGASRVFTSTPSPYDPVAHGAYLQGIVADNGFDLIVFGCTTSGLDLAPVLAFRNDLPLLSYCTAVRISGGTVEADSQIYGGKLVSTAEASMPAVLLVNAGTFSEDNGNQAGNAEIIQLPDRAESSVRLVSANRPDPNAVDITKASRLLCVGRGIGEQDAIEEAREVADLMGGEIVGSRPIIDAGWLPKERQVGKSGRKVKPQLYLALGVSGAPEHIEGMGGAGTIVAINTDASAPIFDHAHFGAAVDVADFLPAFKEALARKAG